MKLKKPKFWDYKKPNIYAYLLLPFSYLIKIINFFKLPTQKNNLKIKTICVGNIYLGGTGKTSLSIKLYEIFSKKKMKTCFVKKFHRNQNDEQKLLKSHGTLFTSSKRIDAVKKAADANYDIAIVDDGLQDTSICYDINLICFNNINWIGNGMTIPSGPLREDLNNLRKYKNVFLNGNLENIENLKNQILKINSNINIFVGKYEPLNLNEIDKKEKYLVFSGIGNHQTFINMIKNNGINVFKDIEFPDHYHYTNVDIKEILLEAKKLNCKIITTEKDYLRLENFNLKEIYCLRSELKIIDEEKFIKSIF